jgi:hypothetical protein
MELFDRRSLIIGVVAGLVVGLLLGLLLFWGLFPVQWTDAHSYDLAPDGRAEFVGLVADSFKLNNDPAQATAFLEGWEPEEKEQAVADAIQMYQAQGQSDKAQAVEDLATVLGISTPGEVLPPTEPTPPAGQAGFFERVRVPCLVFVIVLLVLVLAWIGFRVATRRRTAVEGPVTVIPTIPTAPAVSPVEEWEGVGQPPLGHFFTTYQLGEDTYDESFSIETPMGEFLGECGVGISETIGAGDPDKVTAFEVWLFDKSDIRTVTKVLMSGHAFQDDSLRAKLASKGEAVLAQPGSPFLLDTSGLQVRVDVSELVYGEGDLPPNSFFSKLTVELVAMTKPAGSGDSAF